MAVCTLRTILKMQKNAELRNDTQFECTIVAPRVCTTLRNLTGLNMKIAKTRVVFDRHNKATKKVAASVYIEVSYDRKRNFYNTGVKVCSHQFKDGRVINHGQMAVFQDRINDTRNKIEEYISDRAKDNETFSLDGLKKFMERQVCGSTDSFLRFMLSRIHDRPIAESTRKAHISIYHTLKKWGHIRQFSDITEANVKLWDDLAHKNALKAKSVWNYHKILKIYVREAKRFGHIKDNPYDFIKLKRESSPGHRFITMEDIDKIKSLKLTEKALSDARLCFLFQCYTSLSYSDMRKFDMSDVREVDGKLRLRSLRVKTNEMYNITLMRAAVEVLEECGYKLPVQELHYYNRNLQAIQYRAGIATHLTSHVGRHTFATSIALKHKMPIEVLQKVMGHESIRTTQVYAKVLQESVDAEFDRLDEII